jgi:fructokinase
MPLHRIGIDLGGTKIEIAAMAPDGTLTVRRRAATPASYDAALREVAALIAAIDAEVESAAAIGIGIPGCISPATGLVKNASTNCLNGKPFDRDLAALLGRPVRVENDANCFALSEASDGAGSRADCVFGVILGTGCGAGIVVRGAVLAGRQRIAGEWGHNPLPWALPEEVPGPLCWCGRHNCLETLISGPGLARDCDGEGARDATGIPARAEAGDPRAQAALARHADRVARGLAHVVNVLDPDVIVLGGGLSNMAHLYEVLPALLRRHVFSDTCDTPIVKARHGDSSGVRGAAWLWPVHD